MNSNNQLGVAGDPSQAPYDSVEDTLIGVQNDSSSSITSIPITATTGKPLFGFDGDGLCTFSVPGCPFGATGYEGPGTSFTVNSATSGTVQFSPAIPPGGRAYFSLEEALATSPPYDFTPTPAGLRYVALGDSYSSGEGNPPFLPGTASNGDNCHRSYLAYPELLAAENSLNITSHESRACSGATRRDIEFGSDTENSQLSHLDSSTGIVTIGVGGDDVGFATVLQDCITGLAATLASTHGNADCRNMPATNPDTGAKTNLDGREQALIGDLAKNSADQCQTSNGYVSCSPRLATLYYQIAQASASNVKIFVLLYPHLFTTNPPTGGCDVGYRGRMSHNNIVWLNQGVDRIDSEISTEVAVARSAGVDVTPVDPRPVFDSGAYGSGGHGGCTANPWIYGIKFDGLNPAVYSFHPNPQGQTAFEQVLLRAIRNHP